MIGQKKRLAT